MRLFLLSLVIISVSIPEYSLADNKYKLYHTESDTELNGKNHETFWRNFRAYSYSEEDSQQQPLLLLSPKEINEYTTLTPSDQTAKYTVYTQSSESLVNVQLSSIQNASLSKNPDFKGLVSDTKYYIGYQLGMIVVIFFLPSDISKWDKDTKAGNLFGKYWDNITNPAWDADEWYINYIMHPYFGATYHVRARERGYDPMGGFYYSFLMSTLWEFGLEAFSEPPSIQDIIVTPFYGALLGEFFMQVRKNIKQKGLTNRTAWNKFVLFITDPIGSLNNLFRRWAGWGTHMEVAPFYTSPAIRSASRINSGIDYFGFNNYDDREQIRPNELTRLQTNGDIIGFNVKFTW